MVTIIFGGFGERVDKEAGLRVVTYHGDIFEIECLTKKRKTSEKETVLLQDAVPTEK